jgi:glycosyltransferase involved in cell wall biosynthesis
VSDLAGRRLVHVTSADISLALLLGPQLRAFADAGMEVIGVSAPGPFVDQLTSWGITHVALDHATRSVAVGQDVLALVELERLFRRLRPDIVHTHNPKPGLYGRIAARTAGVPGIVNTVHGLYAAPEDPWLRKSVVYTLERIAATCSDVELFQNPEDLEVMRRLGVPAGHLVLLGNGIDLDRFRSVRTPEASARARRALGVDDSAIVVGTVGRLVWQKGFRELFAAARHLRSLRDDVVFVVVGPEDTAKGDALGPEDIAEARAIGNLVFTGHRDDVEDLYAGFDMYALPSYREGFPRSAMEAAACGVPVIATDIRGCRQVVSDGQSGLLVPLHDPARLAAAIEELVVDPALRKQMGTAGRLKAEAEFDERAVVSKTMDAYERVLERATSSTSRRTPWSARRPS